MSEKCRNNSFIPRRTDGGKKHGSLSDPDVFQVFLVSTSILFIIMNIGMSCILVYQYKRNRPLQVSYFLVNHSNKN